MTDREEKPTHEYYLIEHNLDTGENLIQRVQKKADSRYYPFGKLSPADLPLPECKIGAKVLQHKPEGKEALEPVVEEDESGVNVVVIFRPIEPPEPVEPCGAAYLRTLPAGTVLYSNEKPNDIACITPDAWVWLAQGKDESIRSPFDDMATSWDELKESDFTIVWSPE